MFKSAEYIQRHTHALTTEHYIVALIAPEFLLRMKRETLWCVRNICVLCVHCTHAHTQFKQVRNNVSVRMPPHKYCHRHKTKSNVNICTLKSAEKKRAAIDLFYRNLNIDGELWFFYCWFFSFCSVLRTANLCVVWVCVYERSVFPIDKLSICHNQHFCTAYLLTILSLLSMKFHTILW